MKTVVLSCLCVVALNLGVSAAKADLLIYDNLVATTYDADIGWTVSGSASSVGGDFEHSESFVAVNTASLTQVLLAVWNVNGVNTFDATLTDSSSNVLESWSGLFAPTQNEGIPVVTVASFLHPLLTAGQSYTLTVSPVAGSDTWSAWEFGSTASLNSAAEQSAFRVEGLATPEPGSLTLLGLGLVSVGGMTWMKKRKATAV